MMQRPSFRDFFLGPSTVQRKVRKDTALFLKGNQILCFLPVESYLVKINREKNRKGFWRFLGRTNPRSWEV